MEYELKNGRIRAKVVTKGGELVSLRSADGTEYIWGGDPAYWPGRNPVLFPIVGGLKDGAVEHEGAVMHMGRHGFARDMEFSVAQRGEDYIVLALEENRETMEKYPFRFLLNICHRLTEDGFVTSFEVTNRDEKAMPFCIGAHTAFCCPLYGGERFEDYRIVFDEPEQVPSLRLDERGCVRHGVTEDLLRGSNVLELDYALFERIDTAVFDRPRSRGVSLLHRETGRGVRLQFDGFPMVAFWTAAGKRAPFVCLEPWHGCAAVDNESGRFRDKPYCVTLGPGESKKLAYEVKILSKKQ
ncbi:MAG: aldose 1-epimerase family protein [Oscillospiraceae bacterium]|nr:aldose 1-epimerase family protein [Oscillospiraceae bacterium]